MKSTWMALATLGSALALAGCHGSDDGAQEKSREVAKELPAVEVRTVAATQGSMPLDYLATGSFVAPQSAGVASQVEGVADRVLVDVGQLVTEGAPLVTLRAESTHLALEQARAAAQQAEAQVLQVKARLGASGNPDEAPEVVSAQSNVEASLADLRLAETEERRAENLLRTGDVSRSTLDRARATRLSASARVASARQALDAARNAARQDVAAIAVAQAALAGTQSQVRMAEKGVRDMVVRAPFSGHISARGITAGEYVATTTRLFTLDRLEPLRLILQLPESAAAEIRKGLEVRAEVSAYPGTVFLGKVTAVNLSVDPASRAFAVEATFENRDHRLRPGMFASARIAQGRETRVLEVPASALTGDGRTEGRRIWVVQDGRARLRVVQVAAVREGVAAIETGLRVGDRVVASGAEGLRDGVRVVMR